MNKTIVLVVLIVLAFSFGVIADETLKPDGFSWQKMAYVRQLGFLEGFAEGESSQEEIRTFGSLCKEDHGGDPVLGSVCVLSRLQGGTYLQVDVNKTIETMDKLYASPQNLPVSWGHALVISRAMVSGVPINDKDLETIRQRDAMPSKPISEKELHDILSNTPRKQ